MVNMIIYQDVLYNIVSIGEENLFSLLGTIHNNNPPPHISKLILSIHKYTCLVSIFILNTLILDIIDPRER